MKRALLYFFAIFLFSSCSKNITVCLTSSPDIAFFAEQFNVAQKQEKIICLYAPNCREYLIQAQIPDLIVDWNIQDTIKKVEYKNLSSTIGSKSRYYKGLLNLGKVRGKQFFMPLAFNLPLLAYRHAPGVPEFATSLTFDELAEISSKFNAQNNYEYSKIGFSPLWDKRALYDAYRANGVEFVSQSEGFYVNQISLAKAEEKVNAWVGAIIPDLNREQFFRDKYRNTPGYKLINDYKTTFFYYQTNDFFQIPTENLNNLYFSWLSNKNKIMANEDFLLAAIPREAQNSKGAKAFLKWLLSDATQKELLNKKNQVGYNSFGLCEGFSPIKKINQILYPTIYKNFQKNQMPLESEIIFPSSIPLGYSFAKVEVIEPWLEAKLYGKNEMDLSFELDRWIKQQSFYR